MSSTYFSDHLKAPAKSKWLNKHDTRWRTIICTVVDLGKADEKKMVK